MIFLIAVIKIATIFADTCPRGFIFLLILKTYKLFFILMNTLCFRKNFGITHKNPEYVPELPHIKGISLVMVSMAAKLIWTSGS